jgi:hypothetical protein
MLLSLRCTERCEIISCTVILVLFSSSGSRTVSFFFDTKMADLSSSDVRQLMASYCFASKPQRVAMVLAQPELFQGELLESLEEARELMHSTGAAYDETEKLFSSLMHQLDLPSEGGPQRADEVAPAAPSTVVSTVSTGNSICRREFDILLHALLKDGKNAESAPSAEGGLSHEQQLLESQLSTSSWLCRDASLTLHVLSFLPAEDVLSSCEDTCSAWRLWLCDMSIAGSFWVGVVQREFPAQLIAILSAPPSPDADPIDQDWRTIAMIGVCNADGTTAAFLDDLAGAENVGDADEHDTLLNEDDDGDESHG